MILDSKNIQYDTVDITEPGKESEKEMMQNKSTSNGGTVSDPEPRHPLPPQIFNDEDYCGDYDAFDMANEIDTLEVFLKLAPADTTAVSTATIELKQENGVAKEEGEKGEESGEGDKKTEDKPAAEEKAEGEVEAKAEVWEQFVLFCLLLRSDNCISNNKNINNNNNSNSNYNKPAQKQQQ